jgi:hypothetical protein
LTTLAEDDQLLDALGRGETPNRDDQVATLLGDWRAALPETCPVKEGPGRPRRRRGRLVAAAAVVLVAAGGGVSAAAEHADPDSPLWPVTRLLYSDLADSRAAGHAADEAVTVAVEATENGRYDQAAELLDQAATLVEQVDDPGAAQQLRNRIAGVRAQIATATGAVTDGGVSEHGVSDGVADGVTDGGVTEGIPETPVPPSVNVPSPSSSPAVTTEPGGDNGDDDSDNDGGDNSGGNRDDPVRPGNGQSPAVPALPTVPTPSGPAVGGGR